MVQVKADGHPRKGEAGVVHATNPADVENVAVKFDTDSMVELVAVADLKRLD